jgi:hypothetical protein
MVGSRRGIATQSPASIVPMGRWTIGKGTQPDASASRAPKRRAGAGHSLPCRERTAQVHGLNEQEAEDIDQPSDEEENIANRKKKAPRGPQVTFPTEDEFHAGYILGHDAYFQASIDHIRPVQHVETNHCCLSQQRVREMYMRLAGNGASLITPLTLQPIAYIVEEVGPNDERQLREVPFPASHTVKEFETAYLQNASVVPGMPTMNRIHWLENNIIWEPVDGQHIIAACL